MRSTTRGSFVAYGQRQQKKDRGHVLGQASPQIVFISENLFVGCSPLYELASKYETPEPFKTRCYFHRLPQTHALTRKRSAVCHPCVGLVQVPKAVLLRTAQSEAHTPNS